jgi:DNA-binding MarR family transcriptional regulator
MGTSQAAASRQVAALADHRRKGEGYKVVTDERDPQELRRKVLKLTAKGRRVIKSLVGIWKL